ncbi:hypothetical protein BCR44DRAFT_1436243 [Catenaria anguillulae PL171]|uniref:Uncharacterized protein n=1 Tax=Catenaria anguillulae PL171 TaxID=765915 RepID=A0A1Y2HIL9_9FUNG|nr:hypothetical protein BCR44DRAFT_1436243 [Catenaria anguillulae PL171]
MTASPSNNDAAASSTSQAPTAPHLHNHHQHHVTLKWLALLRRLLLAYTILAALFFLATGLNLAFNIIPTKQDPTLLDTLGNQFFFMVQEVKEWVWVAVALSVIGLIMNIFGFWSFKSERTSLIRIYLWWSLAHLILYAGTMVATLFLMARENPGTRVVSEPKSLDKKDAARSWIVLLTVLLPDWTLWTLIRAGVLYMTWVFYTETKMLDKIVGDEEARGNLSVQVAREVHEPKPTPIEQA